MIYLFNSHIKDENGNLSSSGTAVLKLDTLQSLENYLKYVYFPAELALSSAIYLNITLQVVFLQALINLTQF